MLTQLQAVVWAQWRSIWNRWPRTGWGAVAFTSLGTLLWYGLWTAGAVMAVVILSSPETVPALRQILPGGLLLLFLYWQVIPVALASAGLALDMRRLRIYPIPHRYLFGLEVVLRVSVIVEVVLLLLGAGFGLLLNPALPKWAPLPLIPFAFLNMVLSVAVRDLVGRLLARKRVRELTVIGMVLLAAVPQLLLMTGSPRRVLTVFRFTASPFTPWGAAAAIVQGEAVLLPWLVLAGWCAAGWWFARWQFESSLSFDERAAASSTRLETSSSRWEWFYRWPSLLFRDPIGALVEKELRFLSRAPRFRLVFLMGFSFGLLIWLPIAFQPGAGMGDGAFARNYLVFVSVYALMLLGEVVFYNAFGFDRAAAQVYFVVPVAIGDVLTAKNIAATFFVLLESAIVAVVCALLRLPVTLGRLLEAFIVTLILAIYMLAIGNLSSTHHPRALDPSQSWRSGGAGKFQAMLLFIYPVIGGPVILAYLARYAFDSEAAFYGVLAFAAVLGGIIYAIARESAIHAAAARKERMLAALSSGSGPVTG